MTLAERARAAVTSYWTASLAWAAMSALHWSWLWRSAHAGDVLSAYGAGLVVLGVLVGSRPYLRTGFAQLVESGLPQYDGMTFSTDERWQAHKALVASERPKVRRDVWAERVVAVVVVVVGTLLNGWGTPLARRWGFPV